MEMGLENEEIVVMYPAGQLTEKQRQEVIITDNVNDGSWDFDLLTNDFELDELKEWGLEIPEMEDIEVEMPELADGDKEPFQQITFTLADDQANFIQEKLSEIKKVDTFKYIETFGNQNSNGNALYTIFQEWDRQNK